MFIEMPQGYIALLFGSPVDGHWGIIDTKGNIVVEPRYDAIGEFANGRFWVEENGKQGIIDANGAVVVELKYDFIAYNPQSRIHSFRLAGLCGFMNDDGNHVIAPQYDAASRMTVWAAVRIGDLWGIINPQGEYIFEPQFKYIEQENMVHLAEDHAIVTKNGKQGVVAPDGRVVLDMICDEISGFNAKGVSPACLDGLWGYVDLSGKWVIPPRYDEAAAFGEAGYAPVKMDGYYGMIDYSGNYLIEPVWPDIHMAYSKYECSSYSWDSHPEAYHARSEDGKIYYFDIENGKVMPALPVK